MPSFQFQERDRYVPYILGWDRVVHVADGTLWLPHHTRLNRLFQGHQESKGIDFRSQNGIDRKMDDRYMLGGKDWFID